jgi:hypothetical protein
LFAFEVQEGCVFFVAFVLERFGVFEGIGFGEHFEDVWEVGLLDELEACSVRLHKINALCYSV